MGKDRPKWIILAKLKGIELTGFLQKGPPLQWSADRRDAWQFDKQEYAENCIKAIRRTNEERIWTEPA